MNKPSSDTLRKIVVVAASSVISFITFGVARLAGQLFVACRERFNTGRKEASLPFVLCYTFRTISGPIFGYLGNKFGLRFITSLGCLLGGISVGACFLVEDIVLFTVLWGGCFGFFFGMGSTLIPNILHLYFDKTFNKMHGIYQAGGCMGSLVLPAICEFLLQTYSFSGTLLILSGFILNCVPAAMLLKNPQIVQFGSSNHSKSHKDLSTEEAEKVTVYYINRIESQSSTLPAFQDTTNRNDVIQSKESLYLCNATEDKTVILHSSKNAKLEMMEKNLESCTDTKNHKSLGSSESHSHPFSILFKQFGSFSRNFQVLLDPTYILILISLGISTVVATTLYTVIVDACRDKGIVQDVAVLMTFAVTDMLGRFFLSFVADGGYISTVNLYALCSGGLGLLLMGLNWMDSFYIVLLDITAIGVLAGGVIVVPVGVIREYIENDKINMAFSSRYIVFAMLSFGQSPVIGYFRETLRSYEGLFYLMGCMCVAGSLTTSLIPLAAKYRDRKKS